MIALEPRVASGPWHQRAIARLSLTLLLATAALGGATARAQNATWVGGNAGDPSEWVEPNNWTPATVPGGTATFTNTGVTTVANDAGIVIVGGLSFTSNAQAYTFNINNPFIVNAAGIVNSSASTQTFNVSSGNSLVFQNASTASGGTGAVQITNAGGGFVVFENTSTAGTATILNNSILQFFNTSSAGTAAITNNIQTDFFDNSSAHQATITNAATGTLTFNNASTAGFATVTNAGALQFNNSADAGDSVITNSGNGTIIFSNSSSASHSAINSALVGGAITFNDSSNAGNAFISLKQSNLTFNNSASASTAIIVMSDPTHPGTITFTGNSTAGFALITVIGSAGLGGSLNFLNASTADGAIIQNNAGIGAGGVTNFGTLGGTDTANAGTATIINNASGSTNFFASTSAMNANIANDGGNTSFRDQSTAANAVITNNSGGATIFGVPITGTDTASAGNATITNNSGGTTLFTAATTAANAIIMNQAGGVLQFGDSGAGASTATAANATIINSGVVSFNALTTAGSAAIMTGSGGKVFFFDSSTGGNAQFGTNAGGLFDMSGLTASGMTAGSIAGAGSYILGAKSLTVGSNNLSTLVDGVISGAGGSLTKVGTGTLLLTGIDTYTGPTTINGGTLIVDGSIASSSLTTVNAGATLAGSGTVGTTAINGGTLAPGGSGPFGPLTVQGNLSFTAASTYMIQVSSTNAGLTNVSGSATLGGATVNAVFASSTLRKQYKILSAAGGVNGIFNPTIASSLATVNATLSYDPNDVFLNTSISFTPPGGTLTVNQQNVANTLVNFFNTNGSLPTAFATLTPQGLTVASGELGTGVIQSSMKADDLFLNLLLDPTIAGRAGGFATTTDSGVSPLAPEDEPLAYAAKHTASSDAFGMVTKAPVLPPQPLNRWSVWAAGYGGSETIGGNAVVGSQDLTARTWGTAAGADYKFSPDSLAGFALAGGATGYFLANGLGSGSADLFQAGAYGRQNFGAGYLSAALAYGWHDVTTTRNVALAGFDVLQGRFQANTFSGRFEGGYRFATPYFGITPYAAAEVLSFRLPAYAEQSLIGNGLFALNYAAQTTTDSRSELGFRADRSFALPDGVLTLRSRAAWAHDFDPSRAVTAIFQALPGANFVVNGARPDADSALVSAGAEMKWPAGFSLAATFEGEFAGNVKSYAGKAVAKYSW